jgi:hypothetical protein
MVNLTNLLSLKAAVSAAWCKPDGDHISDLIQGGRRARGLFYACLHLPAKKHNIHFNPNLHRAGR